MSVVKNKTLKRLKCLQETVDEALKKIQDYKEQNSNYINNISEDLSILKDNLTRLETLFRKNGKGVVVGIFGTPARGKSTLIDVFLRGVGILPVQGIPVSTKLGTFLSYKKSKNKESPYTITIQSNTRGQDENGWKEEQIKDIINFTFNEDKCKNPDITSIKVEGPFKLLLGNNITLVDTPGIEFGMRKVDHEHIIDRDIEVDEDRALKIIKVVDIVIFCFTADYSNPGTDVEIYKKLIKKYYPINVITRGDKRQEGDTNDNIKADMYKSYGLNPADTVVVSSKEALEIINNKKNKKNKNITKIINSQFKGENLEGFKVLKEKIEARIGAKKPAQSKKLVDEFEEKYINFIKDAHDKGYSLPELHKKPRLKDSKKNAFGRRIVKVILILVIVVVILAALAIGLAILLN